MSATTAAVFTAFEMCYGEKVHSLRVDGKDMAHAFTAEDARRLAACWNACKGVPTEVLEAQQAGGLPWSVADQIDARVQRDELLAALIECADELRFKPNDDTPSVRSMALTVISKVTGQTA